MSEQKVLSTNNLEKSVDPINNLITGQNDTYIKFHVMIAEINTIENKNKLLLEENTRLREIIAQKDSENITNLKILNDTLQKDLTDRDTKIKNLTDQLKNLQTQVNQKDDYIKKLTEDITDLRIQLRNRESMITNLNDRITELEKSSKRLTKLEKTVEDQRKDINRLNKQLRLSESENVTYKSHMDIKKIMIDASQIIKNNSLLTFTRNDKFINMLKYICETDKVLENKVLEIYKKYNPDIDIQRLNINIIEEVYEDIKNRRNFLAHSDYIDDVDLENFMLNFEKHNIKMLNKATEELKSLTDINMIKLKRKDIDDLTNIVIGISVMNTTVKHVKTN